jgi:hypothetical protein
VRLLACAILLAIASPAFGAIPRITGPNVHGRILFFAPKEEALPLAGGTVELFALDVTKGFAQTGKRPVQSYTDSRGFYSFFDVPSGVFLLQVSRSKEVGGGSIIRVDPGGIAVPDLAMSWTDPCRTYYGRGYAPDYIRAKINVPWRANSVDWLAFAQKGGWRTGTAPVAATIAVFRAAKDLPYGHVAWVDSVSTDQREFVVSQWNEPGPEGPSKCSLTANFGKLTHRRWKAGDSRLLGFVYPGK